jgi:uridine kinase
MPITEIENAKKVNIKTFNYSCDEIDSKIKEKYPFLMPHTHFYYYIVGKSGSGKSTVMMNIVCRFHKKRFDRIFLVSPSFATLEDNPFKEHLPTDQLYDDLEEDVLAEILERIKDSGEKVLLILDDVQDKIKGGIERTVKRMINNRRHISGKGGNLSIIITSQVFNNLSLSIRKSADVVIMFGSKNSAEIESIQREFLSVVPKDKLTEIWDYVYKAPHDFLLIKPNDRTEDFLYKNFNKLVWL